MYIAIAVVCMHVAGLVIRTCMYLCENFYKNHCNSMEQLVSCRLYLTVPPPSPQTHMADCKYRNSLCRQCGQYVLLTTLTTHQEKECPMRTAACKYCGRDVPVVQMEVSTLYVAPTGT